MPWDIQKNKYPSNCNRSLFIYFFQFDFGCTSYSLTLLYKWTVLVHYAPVSEAGLKGECLHSGVPVELNVLPDPPVLVDCPRTLWSRLWGWAEGWASVQWCPCRAECTPWPTCTKGLSSYTMTPSLRLGWRVSVCTVVSLFSWMYSLTHLY